jgi:ATP-binding cassette subfamily F protein uup
MPILDITFCKPLPIALTKFFTAFSADKSPDKPLAISAMFELLLGNEQADSGEFVWGQTITKSYLPNDNSKYFAEPENLVDWLRQFSTEKDETYIRGFLGKMLFSGEEVFKKSNVLSGGEKVRCMVSKMMMTNANFLILDEPTNDLDIQTLNVLEEFLDSYEGCLLVVTHDRYFMDTLVDKLFVFEGNGYIRDFNGNYQDYLNELEENKGKKDNPNKKNPAAKETKEVVPAASKKLSFKEQREFELLASEISELQKQIHAIEKQLSAGSNNHEELLNWSKDIEHKKNLVDEKELRWLELSEMAS